MGRAVAHTGALIAGDKHVAALQLLAEREVQNRLDLKPWVAVYVVAPAIVAKAAEATPGGAAPWVYVASLVAAGALHALCMLVCVWSVGARVRLRYVPSASVHDATHVCVRPVAGRGQPSVCPLVVKAPPADAQRGGEQAVVTSTSFSYQQRTYAFDHAGGQFARVFSPVDLTIASYRGAKGLGRLVDAEVALHRYGKNECKLPRRDFNSSLIEQFSGPFFVFQVFCVLLWLLDDMWHYALFTGLMLVFFECTVAMTRVRNAEQLYKMEPKAQPVLVWREGRWKDEKSTELLPGDLFAMRRVKTHGEEAAVCPCDGVIVAGACVMNEVKLTGESVPQMKESIASEDGSRQLQLGKSVDKNHVVYAGTKLVMVTAGADEGTITTSKIPEPEPGAVLVYALRTGFDTSQGKLMRTILFATDGPVTANSAEAFTFIGGLLVFAVIASGYVLNEGLKDPDRSRWKLFLNCTMILTSVIPPELPMELSLAVNNSLMALMKLGIFCTEPFRIPSAGKVDMCCFDKTGTLTSEKMIMHGIAGVPSTQLTSDAEQTSEGKAESDTTADGPELIDAPDAPLGTAAILAACHSLVVVDHRVFGDPLERVALDAVDWDLGRGDKVTSSAQKASATVVVRHHFDSSLRRMSVIADVGSPGKTRSSEFSGPYVLAKGAPETMEQRFDPKTMPGDYPAMHRHFSMRGARVLALGYRKLDVSWDKIRGMTRDEVERDLTFAGFLVLTCPLKSASAKCIAGLKKSSHSVMMITGDHMLTACYVAQTLRIISQKRRALVLHPEPLEWRTVDAEKEMTKPFSFDASALDALDKKFSLCIGGDGLAALVQVSGDSSDAAPFIKALVSRVKVFARTSPEQKEAIVGWLKDVGHTVLMCGDGTNDVGALKAAHVGVGLLEAEGEGDSASKFKVKKKKSKHKTAKIGSMKALLEVEADMQNTVVQMGDASVASPFTSRQNDIRCTLSIIRQGRCTLVTTTQMFKIIAINCLITAYSLSVLYLDGVKFGDSQATVQGLVVAGAFLFISRSAPLETLSEERPYQSIFCGSILTSMAGQFLVHMVSLMTVCDAAKVFERTAEDLDPEKDFKANVLNSAVFLLSNGMLMTSFFTNYRGAPFMEGLFENRALLLMLGGTQIGTFVCASCAFADLNEYMELVTEWPNEEFGLLLVGVLAADFAGSLAVEWVAGKLFPLPRGGAVVA